MTRVIRGLGKIAGLIRGVGRRTRTMKNTNQMGQSYGGDLMNQNRHNAVNISIMRMRFVIALVGLVISLTSASGFAAEIQVPAGDVSSLIGAIRSANVGESPDVIVLGGGRYDFDTRNNAIEGNNALPLIISAIEIRGNGAIFARTNFADCELREEPTEKEMRFFNVSQRGGLSIDNVTFRYGCSTGSVSPNSFGGAIYNRGTLSVTNSTFEMNQTNGNGGAIYSSGNASITITNVTFKKNVALATGGAVASLGSNGSLAIRNSYFSENGSGNGGGAVRVKGRLNIENSTFYMNVTDSKGGAVSVQSGGNATIKNSTFSNNKAEYGGAISNSGSLKVLYSTIADNEAFERAGGINSSGSMEITHSIVAKNTPENCDIDDLVPFNPNLSDDESCYPFSLLSEANLENLSGSGSGQVFALGQNSPAVDAVSAAECTATQDQRGDARPQGDGCDLGAYESAYTAPQPEPTPEPEPTPQPPTPTPTPTPEPPTPSPNPGGGLEGYDLDGNCEIGDSEFFGLIDAWLSQIVDDSLFFAGVDAWIGQTEVCVVASSSAPSQNSAKLAVQTLGERGVVFTMNAPHGSQLNVEILGQNGVSLHKSQTTRAKMLWNLRNESGERAANGVYFARIIVRDVDGSIVDQQLRKFVVLR